MMRHQSHPNDDNDDDDDDMSRVHTILRAFGREDLVSHLDVAADGAVDGTRGYVLPDGTVIPPDPDNPDPWGDGGGRHHRRGARGGQQRPPRHGRRHGRGRGRGRDHTEYSPASSSDSEYSSRDQHSPSKPDAEPIEPPELPGVEIPPHFLCPILRDLMMDPVVATDGHTYERHAIKTWLKGHTKSPMTGKVMRSRDLTPNFTLRSMINDFIDKHKAASQKGENEAKAPAA
jgi:hypothetical protein